MTSQDLLPQNEFSTSKPASTPEHITFVVDCGDHLKIANTRNPKKVKRVRKS